MFTRNATAREVLLSGASLNPEDRAVKEENFFSRIPLQNGHFKMTSANRLDDVIEIIVRHIRGRWSDEILRVLDVGVSSGITTIELAEALRRSGRLFKIVGTDLCIEASLLSYGRHLHVLCDRQGQALQFELLGFPVSNYLGTGFWSWLRRIVPVLFARVLFGLLAFPPIRRLIGPPLVRPVRLLTGRWQDDPDVEFVQEDLFGEITNGSQYHFIRAANILNRRIFSTAQLRRAIGLLRARLRTGGSLLILRTHEDRSNHGALYDLQNDGSFRRVVSFGEGCEVEPVLLAIEREVII